jgi:hypothetical protein
MEALWQLLDNSGRSESLDGSKMCSLSSDDHSGGLESGLKSISESQLFVVRGVSSFVCALILSLP